MITWKIILVPIGLIILGLLRQYLILRKKKNRRDLSTEFLDTFTKWHTEQARDDSLYNWMLNKSRTIQDMLAGEGLVSLRRPFEDGYHQNYAVIINAIPEIQHSFKNDLFQHSSRQSMIQVVDCSLRRFIGAEEEQIRCEHKRLFNPLVLFCGGVRWLLELPLFILSETKSIAPDRREAIVNSRVFSLLSGIVTLITLIASIITIITNRKAFFGFVTEWMK